jgi:hypothetical protein
MFRKKIAGAVIASVAIAMVVTVSPQANAALKAPTAANVGDQCGRLWNSLCNSACESSLSNPNSSYLGAITMGLTQENY